MTDRGFGTIAPLASGRYRARYTGPDGVKYSAKVQFQTKRDARAWLNARHNEIVTARWKPPAVAGETFGSYAARWIKERDLAESTREDYEDLLAGHLAPLAGLTLRAITAPMITTWHAGLRSRPRPRTVPRRGSATDRPRDSAPGPLGRTQKAHCYSLVRSILNTAEQHDLIDRNPCRIPGAGTSGKAVHKAEPATLAQVGLIMDHMPDRFAALVLLATWDALRFGEAVALRRFDVEPDGSAVRVRRGVVRLKGRRVEGDTKTESSKRDINTPPHLHATIVDHLARFVGPEPDALLFPGPDGRWLSAETHRKLWLPAREAAGLPGFHWHDLRHTGAVLAASTGATLAELMARLGHSTPAAALRYQHAAAGRDKIIAAKLSELAG